MSFDQSQFENSIAVIGYAGQFPDAESVETLWENLCIGKESVVALSREQLQINGANSVEMQQPNFVPCGVELEGKASFDANFFGFSSKEALITDPQQRLLLQCAYHVLEQAGYKPMAAPLDVGVFVGTDPSSYFINNVLTRPDITQLMDPVQLSYTNIGCATQLSYYLNLSGPSINLYTACSTSLVSVHQACRSLMMYESTMAIAGGASINPSPVTGYLHQAGSVYSSDGHCRAFDDEADGTVAGQGMGLVLLKRYEDAIADEDHIYGVIRGTAINNDAQQKVGYTAPSVEGQIDVIQKALSVAEVKASDVGYIECHGTGTELGDPIELTALNEVYGARSTNHLDCILGSIKSNIGHSNAAAGIAGLLKALLVVNKGIIPPTLHFNQFNRKVDLSKSRFSVNTQLIHWSKSEDEDRIAAVSSFGIGGTNAHVILQAYPSNSTSNHRSLSDNRPYTLLTVSAKSEQSLVMRLNSLCSMLEFCDAVDVKRLGYTLSCVRNHFKLRKVFVVASESEALEKLKQPVTVNMTKVSDDQKLAFVFSPDIVASNICHIYRYLYENNRTYNDAIFECAHYFKQEIGINVADLLYPTDDDPDKRMQQSLDYQAILFTFQYAIALWMLDMGVVPSVIHGEGLGEYVAAAVAGKLSLEDAIRRLCHKISEIGEADNHSISEMLQTLVDKDEYLFIKVGSLESTLVDRIKMQAIGRLVNIICVSSYCRDSIEGDELRLLGDLWAQGVSIDFQKLYSGFSFKDKVELPHYPFEKTHYWLEPPKNVLENQDNDVPQQLSPILNPEDELQKEILIVWQQLLGVDYIGLDDNFFKLGGHSLMAFKIISRVNQLFDMKIQIDEFASNPTVRGLEALIIENHIQSLEGAGE